MIKKMIQAIMPSQKMIEMFTLKLESDQPIETIAQKVSGECENHKFALLQTYVYHDIVEKKGFPINRKVFIYEICQAKTAALMLTSNPEFSIFMPCKIAMYEDAGKMVISTMNMEIMLNAVKSNPELYKEATTIFKTLKYLMTSLSKV
ncbi:MAG: hypothetical protein CVU08_08180 [Bacteroidetes bacterium HGW-Bacteroidetes-3]|jgi:uncharacterized protein (DUF302 family)|nr:MAG: hypothetical protein CVU08_08180 [Bacteroidetes bacterium HGW-Bacteroidetes-3]